MKLPTTFQKVILTVLLWVIFLPIFAQNLDSLISSELFIASCFQKMIKSKSDSEKNALNIKVIEKFDQALSFSESKEFPFSKLKNMAILTSKDKRLRVINWNLPQNDGTQKYYGYLQFSSKKSKPAKVKKLFDLSDQIENPENATLSAEHWWGALYYDIVEITYKKTTSYILLGWDGNSDFSTKKIIDVLTFDQKETPKFGSPIFNSKTGKKKRIIFEYAHSAKMLLNYDKNNEIIVFDHLAPPSSLYTGQYQFYGPDFSYDAYLFEKGSFVLKENVDVRNPPKKIKKRKKEVSDQFYKSE